MSENIRIRNFGPIQDIDMPIKPLTVFIGESGSGKSTIMKVVVLFRWIYKMVNIRSYLYNAGVTKSPFRFRFDYYAKNNGLEDFFTKETFLEYRNGNVIIRYEKKKLDAGQVIPNNELSLDKLSFITDKRTILAEMLSGKTNMLGANFFLDETYYDVQKALDKIQELEIDYLKIKFVTRKTSQGKRYFIENNNPASEDAFSINYKNASSGMQNVTPLSMIAEFYAKHYDFVDSFNKTVLSYMAQSDNLKSFSPEINIGEIQRKTVHLHIEEPELSLYPESQRDLTNFLINRCFVLKHREYNMTLMMATHSPYIINHLNLLVLAAEKNETIHNAAINYGNVAAYQLIDGYLRDLKQKSKKIIDTRDLSEPISDIYAEYGILEAK